MSPEPASRCCPCSTGLAPEHPHPVPVEDAYAGLTWLAGHAGELGIDPGRIAVMGGIDGCGIHGYRTDLPRLRAPCSRSAHITVHAERRLSEALPVYAAPDQDVCGVDM